MYGKWGRYPVVSSCMELTRGSVKLKHSVGKLYITENIYPAIKNWIKLTWLRNRERVGLTIWADLKVITPLLINIMVSLLCTRDNNPARCSVSKTRHGKLLTGLI